MRGAIVAREIETFKHCYYYFNINLSLDSVSCSQVKNELPYPKIVPLSALIACNAMNSL